VGVLQLAAAPAPSTITAILERHGQLAPVAERVRPWRRFEQAAPNDLWQVDFMGHRPLAQGRVHPLTVLDDHSRFAVGVIACPHEQQTLVQAHLTACFRRYGLPQAILTDNGPPWGTSGAGGITALEAWLLRLGVAVWHGRAYHPQTQGKVERFHRTIAAEAFRPQPYPSLVAAQTGFDAFRHGYNHDRPHIALADAVPLARYTPSPRSFPETLPPIEYGSDDQVRRVRSQGAIFFQNRSWFVGSGLIGLDVAVRPTADAGVWAVVFCQREVARLDLRNG
jgi:transposase InsO family protein